MAKSNRHSASKNQLNIAAYWYERLAGACRQMQIERAALAIQDREMLLCAGYGNTPDVQRTAHEQYAVLCVAKLFTATLIALLVTRRKLMFSSLVCDLLPEAAGVEVLQGVRVAHLLAHSHGLCGTTLNIAPVDAQGFIDTKAVVASLQAQGRAFAPGTFFSYSAAGYLLLGCIVEYLTQTTFRDVLQHELLARLSFQGLQSQRADRAQAGASICPSSGYGLRLSIEELLAFAGNFAGFARDGLEFPAPLLNETLATQQTLPGWSPVFSGCGYGWKNFNNGWYGHNGIDNGRFVYLRINPARNTVICLAAESPDRDPGALPALLLRTAYPALCLSNARQPRFINEPTTDGSDAIVGTFGRAHLSFRVAPGNNRLTVEIRSMTSSHTMVAHRSELRAAEEHIYFLEKPWQNITFLQLVVDESGRRYLWDHTQLWPELMAQGE